VGKRRKLEEAGGRRLRRGRETFPFTHAEEEASRLGLVPGPGLKKWANRKQGHIECGGRRGTRPAKRGGKWAVGIRQCRRFDLQDGGELKGRARHNTKPALCTEYVSYM
jgi:hypothetical protein